MNPKVAQLTAKIQKVVTIEDPKLGKLEWTIRPLPALVLLEHLDVFNKVQKSAKELKEFDADKVSDAELESVQGQILPMMKTVLPNCVIDPPIAIDDNDPRIKLSDALSFKDLPFRTVIDLFNEIMKISGLDEASEEARKKLESQISVKV